MKTINVIIERANDGTFGAYAENVPGIYGAGDNVKEVKQSILDGIETMKEIGSFPPKVFCNIIKVSWEILHLKRLQASIRS